MKERENGRERHGVRARHLEIQGIFRGGRHRPPQGERAAIAAGAGLPSPAGSRANAPPMDYRIYRLSPREWVLYGGEGIAFCALAAYVFYRSLAVFAVMAPLGLLYPLYRRRDLQRERTERLNLQFKEGISVLASFLSAGYSLENALAMSAAELEALYGRQSMMAGEFDRIAAGARMNQPVEKLFMDFGRRSGSQEADSFAQVLAAARRSGGELVEIIGHTAGIIRDKMQVQEEIHTMTASRVFEQKIMNAVPFGVVLYIDLTSPGFFRQMYSLWSGRIVMTICLVLYGAAVLLAKRILAIEV